VPCLDKWNAFIFASMLCAIAPPEAPRVLMGPGLRALLSMPRGVEEAVMEAAWESETERRDGTRAESVDPFEVSGWERVARDSSEEPEGGCSWLSTEDGPSADCAKSMESSGAPGCWLVGGEAIILSCAICKAWRNIRIGGRYAVNECFWSVELKSNSCSVWIDLKESGLLNRRLWIVDCGCGRWTMDDCGLRRNLRGGSPL
jgi:hypothetical protein